MIKFSNRKGYKIIFIFIFLTNFYNNNYNNDDIFDNFFQNKTNYLKPKSFYDLFNSSIKKNTILIIEPNEFHHECTPGNVKYFIDLGYNVDVLIHISGNDSFCFFPENKNIRLRTFNNLNQVQIYIRNLSEIIKKYDYILLQSNYMLNRKLYSDLGIYNRSNTFFIDHELKYINNNYERYYKENRIFTIGKAFKGIQINPHYFGDIKIKEKNDEIIFFITSTVERNYKPLIESSEKLKMENFPFKVIITGRSSIFNISCIPKILIDNFKFNYNISYSKLYRLVENSDYIIIPLDPKSPYDITFKSRKSTGSIQLVYGFLKPAILNREFAYYYKLNKKNSLLYKDYDLYHAMKKAILLNKKEYKVMQKNLYFTQKYIYKVSINNLKKLLFNK